MEDIFKSDFSRYGTAFCFISAPLMLLVVDLFYLSGNHFATYISSEIAVGLLMFSVIALMLMLRPKAEKAGFIAGAIALLGTLKGTTIFAFYYLREELPKSGLDAATMQAFQTATESSYQTVLWLVFPGPLFPLGLLLLGIVLLKTGTVSRVASVALILGAIVFPVGRFSGILGFVFTSDVLLIVSFISIGWQVLNSSPLNQRSLSFSKT